jgi:ATP-dependent RNA helicase RhlE
MSFENLQLPSTLLQRLKEVGFEKPYPIQEKVIPEVLAGKDVLGIAKTGSGKTASFALPILTKTNTDSSKRNRNVDTLILVPTRELAEQVKDVFYEFSGAISSDIRTMAVYGGVAINPQMKKLNGINILVATPGRLIELVENNALSLNTVSTLVLDEADKMLNLGFENEMKQILSLLPTKRQNLLFSATLSPTLEELHQIVLNDPSIIKVDDQAEQDVSLINQTAYSVSEERKGPFLRYLIKTENMKQVLVFVASAKKADNLAFKLKNNGLGAQSIHGKKTQAARTKALNAFKRGDIRILVATDLLARGIDIQSLPYVINYELPRSPKDYVHRIGRTGRAENEGQAISLISPSENHHFNVIQKKMKHFLKFIYTDEIDLHGM